MRFSGTAEHQLGTITPASFPSFPRKRESRFRLRILSVRPSPGQGLAFFSKESETKKLRPIRRAFGFPRLRTVSSGSRVSRHPVSARAKMAIVAIFPAAPALVSAGLRAALPLDALAFAVHHPAFQPARSKNNSIYHYVTFVGARCTRTASSNMRNRRKQCFKWEPIMRVVHRSNNTTGPQPNSNQRASISRFACDAVPHNDCQRRPACASLDDICLVPAQSQADADPPSGKTRPSMEWAHRAIQLPLKIFRSTPG